MLLSVHIAAGGVAIVLGAFALAVKKGGTLHRRSGLAFVGAMLVMGASASILALRSGQDSGNVMAGLITLYFVVTAVTTVRRTPWTRRADVVAAPFALGLAMIVAVNGVSALNARGVSAGGVPLRTVAVVSLVLSTVLCLAAVGDFRVTRCGPARGGQRLRRHLWRMCFALFIAAGSFFSIRARVAAILPEPLTSGRMRSLPILLLFGAMFYWLWRLRGGRLAGVHVTPTAE
ncbi:MAG: DUF2306 domain-containing protein [Gemmatimonadaceae bacterium]